MGPAHAHILRQGAHFGSIFAFTFPIGSLFENVGKLRGSESSPYHRNAESRFALAHVLLCLSNCKCVISSRANGPDGHYSAGWSLYRAARDIFGDLLDVFSECSNQILLLQTILLMVRSRTAV
jgi:hypothetical protein